MYSFISLVELIVLAVLILVLGGLSVKSVSRKDDKKVSIERIIKMLVLLIALFFLGTCIVTPFYLKGYHQSRLKQLNGQN